MKPRFLIALALSLGAGSAYAAPPARHTVSGDYLIAEAAEHDGDWTLAGKLLADTWQQSHDPETLREAFLISLGAGDIPQALKLSQSITPAMPEIGVAKALQLADAIHNDDMETANRLALALPERGIGVPLKTMLSAWLEAAHGDRAAATAHLATLTDFDTYRRLHEAQLREFAGDKSGADTAYAALGDGEPLPRVASIAADYYRRTNRPQLAGQILRRVNPDNSGLAAISLNASEAPARPKPTLVSGTSEAFYNAAELLLEADHPDIALFYAQIAQYVDPAKSDTHLLLGEIEQAEGRYSQAATDFMAVPEKSAFGLLGRLSGILALDKTGDTKKAMQSIDAFAKAHPTLAEPKIEQADLLRRYKKYPQAVTLYGQALQIMKPDDSRRATVIFSRAIAYDELHDTSAAETDLKQAVALAPKQPTMLNYLGYFWARQGQNLAEAQALLESAYRLAPRDGAVVDSLGWVLYKQGDYAGAVAKLEQAVRLMPGDSEINGHLGDAYWQVGRKTDARFQWRHALLNASSDTAGELRSKLSDGLTEKPVAKPMGESHAELEQKN